MTLQMNSIALISKGYKLVAEYQVWQRYETGDWMPPTTYTCYQKGNSCVVKIVSRRNCFTKCFDTKEKANAFIQTKLTNCENYKKLK